MPSILRTISICIISYNSRNGSAEHIVTIPYSHSKTRFRKSGVARIFRIVSQLINKFPSGNASHRRGARPFLISYHGFSFIISPLFRFVSAPCRVTVSDSAISVPERSSRNEAVVNQEQLAFAVLLYVQKSELPLPEKLSHAFSAPKSGGQPHPLNLENPRGTVKQPIPVSESSPTPFLPSISRRFPVHPFSFQLIPLPVLQQLSISIPTGSHLVANSHSPAIPSAEQECLFVLPTICGLQPANVHLPSGELREEMRPSALLANEPASELWAKLSSAFSFR